MKRRLAALSLEPAVIAPIIVKPEAKKDRRHKQTVKNGGAGEIEHALELGRGAVGGARISVELSSGAEAPIWVGIWAYDPATVKIKTRRNYVGALK